MEKNHNTASTHKMVKTQLHPFNKLLLLVPLLFLMKMCCGMPVLDLNSIKTGELDAMVKRACTRKISDCSTVSVEEEMDSESHKRMLLMQRRFISYDTLKRDFAPCNRPGSSYYNCKAAGPVNTYNRGCEIITRTEKCTCHQFVFSSAEQRNACFLEVAYARLLLFLHLYE